MKNIGIAMLAATLYLGSPLPLAAQTPPAQTLPATVQLQIGPAGLLPVPPDAPPPKPQPPVPYAVSVIAESSLPTRSVYRPTGLAAAGVGEAECDERRDKP